jgi:hypothetical protein
MNPIKSFIFILFLFFWFAILTLCGTLFSGYHFMDDHGIFRESQEVANSNLQKEVKIFKKNLLDPKMRFRPFYWVHRRSMLAVLGTDFTAMSIYIGFLAVFTSFFLFLFMKRIGFSVVESVLFVGLTLLGEQAAIWWRLGNNETLGMLMLSIALLFMALSSSARQKRKKILYEILFVLSVTLASWSKESFILIIPALLFGKIWLTWQKKQEPGQQEPGNSKQTAKGTWLDAVKENLIPGILLLLVCLIELVHVIKNVGTTKIVYAGYEGFQLANFVKTGIQGFMAVHGWVILLLLILCLRRPGGKDGRVEVKKGRRVEQSYTKSKLKTLLRFIFSYLPTFPPSHLPSFSVPRKNFLLTQVFWAFVLVGLIAVPQIVLYMKSGMMDRYLLPGIMGYTFLMVVLLRYIRETGSKKVVAIIAALLLAVISLQQLRVTRYTAIGFANEGKQIDTWLQSIEQNTGEQDKILIVTHIHKHFEGSISLKMVLDVKSNRKNTLFTPANLQGKSAAAPFWKELNRYFFSQFKEFTLENSEDRNRLQAILVFPGLEEKFLKASAHWFNPTHFKRYTNAGGYVSYYKKAVGGTKNP